MRDDTGLIWLGVALMLYIGVMVLIDMRDQLDVLVKLGGV